MRIISGNNRGAKLYTLEGLDTRPTLDRVKEPLFSIIASSIPDGIILDLFSGSGALGLESVSRGAKKSYLCDFSKDAINIINKNVQKLRVENNVQVDNLSYEKALDKYKNIKFDIVFLDPPYKTDYAAKACKYILDNNMLAEDGIIVVETDELERTLDELGEIKSRIYNQKKYGRVSLIFIK